jgi:toxin ParE1/3/4
MRILRGIYEYIVFTLYEPEVAAGQLDRIESAIMSLDEIPERFRLYEKEPWHSRGLRQFPIDNYIFFIFRKLEIKLLQLFG